jgi:uncharacterized membrane protein YgcG
MRKDILIPLKSSVSLSRGGLVVLLTVAALVAPHPAAARAQAGEAITSDSVDIHIEPDGSILVSERIVYDFGSSQRHGIVRDIVDRLTYDSRSDRVYPIDRVAVSASAGTPAGFEIRHEGNLFRIRVGDPNTTVTGSHGYTISYRVRGALNAFSDHDELYWNATGNEWPVPIERAKVRVFSPADILRVACFAGPTGSNLSCADSRSVGARAVFGDSGLDADEGLTIVVGIPTGVVPAPKPILEERWSLQAAFELTPVTGSLAGGLLLILFLGIGRLLWARGRDRRTLGSPVDTAFATPGVADQPVPLFEHGATPVEYAPPEDIRPGQVGTLVDETANPLDATATIIDLAVRGYLRIEEIPKKGLFGKTDWHMVRLKASDGDLITYESSLLDGLFKDGDEVSLSELRRHFSARLVQVENELYDDAASRGWFAARPDKVRQQWFVRGWLVFFAGAGLVYLAAKGSHLALIPVPIALAGLLLAGGAHWMPRRTAKGTGMVRRVLGFRTYIETAESQEAKFQERENIFSKYLPYAIVFGCTEKWARAFAHLDDQQLDTGGWYVGSSAFTIASFASSIDGFSVATAGTIAATPAGSGSSGFGGGGFSGGGGGGGGGGSW